MRIAEATPVAAPQRDPLAVEDAFSTHYSAVYRQVQRLMRDPDDSYDLTLTASKQGKIEYSLGGGRVHPLVDKVLGGLRARKVELLGWNHKAAIGVERPTTGISRTCVTSGSTTGLDASATATSAPRSRSSFRANQSTKK